MGLHVVVEQKGYTGWRGVLERQCPDVEASAASKEMGGARGLVVE